MKPINDSLVPHNAEGSISQRIEQGKSSKDLPSLKGKEKEEKESVVENYQVPTNRTTSNKGKEKVSE